MSFSKYCKDLRPSSINSNEKTQHGSDGEDNYQMSKNQSSPAFSSRKSRADKKSNKEATSISINQKRSSNYPRQHTRQQSNAKSKRLIQIMDEYPNNVKMFDLDFKRGSLALSLATNPESIKSSLTKVYQQTEEEFANNIQEQKL